MLTYAIKRVLLIIPTFFAISLIVFVLVNIGAGDPGSQQSGTDGTQDADKEGNQESYRIFKEQFGLDKPILFNTRFSLTPGDIRDSLKDAININNTTSIERRISAQEEMDDWGKYAVPGLIDCLTQCKDERLRAKSSQHLAINAQARLLTGYTETTLEPEEIERQKEANKVIRSQNQTLKTQTYQVGDTAKRIEAVTQFWQKWWGDNQQNWQYSLMDKGMILFLDTRFATYWGNLLRLDFGKSHIDKRPVLDTVLSKLKYSLTLAVSSVLLIYLISLPLGIWSAVRQGTLADQVVTFVLFMLYSLPSFFVAVILLNLFTVGDWAVFPNLGFQSDNAKQFTTLEYIKDVLWHVCLPIVCMSYGGLAALSRYARTGLLDVIRADYIRTARAKGLPEGVVIIKHAARNGMIPIITLMA
ncbi:MAG: ABC transporter permease, partial [Bradymonadia bacterium]